MMGVGRGLQLLLEDGDDIYGKQVRYSRRRGLQILIEDDIDIDLHLRNERLCREIRRVPSKPAIQRYLDDFLHALERITMTPVTILADFTKDFHYFIKPVITPATWLGRRLYGQVHSLVNDCWLIIRWTLLLMLIWSRYGEQLKQLAATQLNDLIGRTWTELKTNVVGAVKAKMAMMLSAICGALNSFKKISFGRRDDSDLKD